MYASVSTSICTASAQVFRPGLKRPRTNGYAHV